MKIKFFNGVCETSLTSFYSALTTFPSSSNNFALGLLSSLILFCN